MGQIIKSLMSFCQFVCKHSCGRNLDSILMKFCTVIRSPKSEIEFVWDEKSDNSFPYFTPIFKKNCITAYIETSKRYNLVLVKDNCALCLPTPLFSGSGNLTVLFKFTLYQPCCHSNHSKVAKFCITANGDLKAYVLLGPRKR